MYDRIYYVGTANWQGSRFFVDPERLIQVTGLTWEQACHQLDVHEVDHEWMMQMLRMVGNVRQFVNQE